VASAGDNALALLALDPAEVVAVDRSAAQLACLELRMAAIRRLEEAGLLAFLGVTPARDRLGLYRELRADLSPAAQAFWDASPRRVERGIIHAGRFERYLDLFRRWLLPLIHSRAKVRSLLEPRSRAERERFYDDEWNTWRWRALFRLFFSRAVMARLGRDPTFFAHVEGSVAEALLARTRRALTTLPTDSNPYLARVVTGTYPPKARPRYLRSEQLPVIRARLDRLRCLEGALPGAAEGRYHGFNLSDIFEYMGADEFEQCYSALVDHASSGARIVYWNMMVRRRCPPRAADRACSLEPVAGELHARDKVWFYRSLEVDEVTAGDASRVL
jgi:S-adenosylmethionine-diacylglycerol 3-amino-3-carboxypropyl transferase